MLKNSRDETITFNGKNLKSADAVTYDDNGVRMPLGERDNFGNPDVRYSETSAPLEGNTPWTKDIAAEASDNAISFFNKDVVPRLERSRRGTNMPAGNSPLLGRLNFDDLGSRVTGKTEATVHNKNGVPYVVTMNERDMSPIDNKFAQVIHEMRHDMQNSHKGLYDKKRPRGSKIHGRVGFGAPKK